MLREVHGGFGGCQGKAPSVCSVKCMAVLADVRGKRPPFPRTPSVLKTVRVVNLLSVVNLLLRTDSVHREMVGYHLIVNLLQKM